MKFSIIIPNWNGQKLLEKNLPAVLATGANEVIVVDNGSTDGSVEYLRNLEQKRFRSIEKTKEFSKSLNVYNSIALRVIFNKQNLGFAKAVNQGVKEAKNEIVVLLNNDVVPEKDFLKPLEEDFKDLKVFAVSLGETGWSWARGRWIKGFVEHESGPRTKTPHISFWASGGSGAFRKDLWEKLGGFDEIFRPFYWEDIDLSYRAWKRGYKIIWDPRSVVYHQHEGTIGVHFPQKYIDFISQRNQLLFIIKNITNLPMIFQNRIYLWKRLLANFGYWKVLGAVLLKVPRISPRLIKEFLESKVSDKEIFAKF